MLSLTFPTLIERLTVGRELTFAEGDNNLSSIRAYCLALLQVIQESLNPDGTLTAGAVSANSILAGSVGLNALDSSIFYNLLPIASDTGVANAYAIVTAGPVAGPNLVPAGSVYIAPTVGAGPGTFTLTGLTVNSYYSYKQGVTPDNDAALIVNSGSTISGNGIFQATQTSVTLTGTPGDAVTASVSACAAVTSYKQGMTFFVHTANASTGPSTLNVNGMGAIPIKLNGADIGGAIGINSVFAVTYWNGQFILMSGGGSTNASTIINSNSFSGIQSFNPASIPLLGAGGQVSLAHGLSSQPTGWKLMLINLIADNGYVPGQQLESGAFSDAADGNPNFTVFTDVNFVNITQTVAAPYLANAVTGAQTAINPLNWTLLVSATITAKYSAPIFPAVTFMANQVGGSASYSGTLLMFLHSQYNGAAGNYVQAVNLLNSNITPVTGNPGYYVNGSPFARANGTVDYVFMSNIGLCRTPLVQFNRNIVPLVATYDGSGNYVLPVMAGVTYAWTKNANDTKVAAAGIGGVDLSATGNFTPTGTTVTLVGIANAPVTATAIQPASSWQMQELLAYGGYYQFKPVEILEVAGNITSVYVASSTAVDTISNIRLFQVNTPAAGANPSTVLQVANNLNLTSANIANIANFNVWHQAGSAAQMMLFQFNPVKRRIYVITNETAALHIFQIAAVGFTDFLTWWNTASGSAAGNREPLLTYIKSIAIPGDGAPHGDVNAESITIEFDVNSGAEKAITINRRGNATYSGSVTLVPWIE